MDLRKWIPDERLIHIYSGVARCLTVWDGYQFPVPGWKDSNMSGVLSGSQFDISLLPMPGFVNFYALNETTTTDEDHQDHQKALWCGPSAKLFAGMAAAHESLAFQFKILPISAAQAIDLFVSRHFGGMIDPFPRGIYWAIPVLRPSKQPMAGLPAGQLIMKRRYMRRDLAFLQSFTDVSWGAIAVTLLGLSLVASLLYEVRLTFVRSKRRKHHRRTVWSRCFQRFINTLFLLCSLLLAESSGDVEWMNSLLLSLWLLAATIFSGCMNGSMRDLMSAAAQELVPETWDDVWTTEPFSSMTLWAATFMPTWPTFRDTYRGQIDERLAAGRMHVSISTIQDLLMDDIVERELNWYIHAITVGVNDVIFLAIKTLVYSIMWASILYAGPLIEYIARSDELLVLPADEDRQVTELDHDERLSIAHDNYLDFWNEIYDFYYSPTEIEEPLFCAVSSFAPTVVMKFFDTFVGYLTEHGHAALCLSIVDLMEEHFFKLRRSTTAYEDLLLLDFYGPLMCYAIIIAAALSAFLAELWWFNRVKTVNWWTRIVRKPLKLKNITCKVANRNKVYPLPDVKVSSRSEDSSESEMFTKCRSKRLIKRIVIK